MPNYTLHYFNGRGRAEVIRMMFHMAGVKYMDKRYEFSDWDRCRNGKNIFFYYDHDYHISAKLTISTEQVKAWGH